MTAETKPQRGNLDRPLALQWSRRRVTAETGSYSTCWFVAEIASMEPPSGDGGDLHRHANRPQRRELQWSRRRVTAETS